MKKHLIYLCACVCALLQSGCTGQNTPDANTYKYNTYIEPSFQWGEFRSVIDWEMKDLGFVEDANSTQGIYSYTTYKPLKDEKMTCTFFLSDGLTYEMASVYVSTDLETNLRGFLDERYNCIYQRAALKDCLYRTKDGKTEIEIKVIEENAYNKYFVIVYSPRK